MTDAKTAAKPAHAAPATFPSWFYGPNGQRKVVQTAEELKSLGEGWYDSPDKAEAHDQKNEKPKP